MTNGIPLGRPLILPVGTVNCVQTLKDLAYASGEREDYDDLDGLTIYQRCVNPANLPPKPKAATMVPAAVPATAAVVSEAVETLEIGSGAGD
jgi:hypothetical protein